MNMMEAATELGTIIRESETYRRFSAAKAAYEGDEKLSEYLREYEADRRTLERASTLEAVDTLLIDTLKARLDEIYTLVSENPVYTEYIEAQEEVNRLMEQVNEQITFAVTGKRPQQSSCCSSGGCAGCSGCGGH